MAIRIKMPLLTFYSKHMFLAGAGKTNSLRVGLPGALSEGDAQTSQCI